jgi:cytochrome b involved in lipid metabolism
MVAAAQQNPLIDTVLKSSNAPLPAMRSLRDGLVLNDSSLYPVKTDSSSQTDSDATVCDACPHCDDCCENSGCFSCNRKSVCMPCCPEATYTMCQVRRHNHEKSAWLVAGDRIYDATPFLKTHPGGSRSILRKAGGVADCSADMQFHSKSGVKMWKKAEVGKLVPCGPCKRESQQCKQWWMFWSS